LNWVDRNSQTELVTFDDILKARGRLADFDASKPVNVIGDAELGDSGFRVLNVLDTTAENHSFKYRGAYNFIAHLIEQQLELPAEKREVLHPIAPSAGNHAQGIAMVMKHFGDRGMLEEASVGNAKIYMPETTVDVKINATRNLGGEFVNVIVDGQEFNDAKSNAFNEISRSPKSNIIVSPYDHPDIIAGQGTLAIEMLERFAGRENLSDEEILDKNSQFRKDLDRIIGHQGENLINHVPAGGGGLVAGAAIVMSELAPKSKTIAVEPDYVPSVTKSLIMGRPVRIKDVPKEVHGIPIAGGVAIEQIGDIPLKILQHCGVSAQTVNAKQIHHVTKLLNDNEKGFTYPVEQSGAIAGAVTLNTPKEELQGKVVANYISGANSGKIELDKINESIDLNEPFPTSKAKLSYAPKIEKSR